MNHTLEVDGVQLQFGERKVLSGIYLKCETGKITGLLGRNGQGKSCLMRVIYGSQDCERSVRINHKSVVGNFTSSDNLMFLPQFNFIPGALTLRRVFVDFGLNLNEFLDKFSEFAIKDKGTVGSLSGGQRRLLELYVIAKSRTRFAMLDEPFTHLGPLQIEKVKIFLEEEKKNKGFLITDHMYRLVMDISDSLYVLSGGKTYLTKYDTDIETFGYARS